MYPTPQKVQIDLTGAEDYYQYLEQQLNCEKFKINDFSEQNNLKSSLITQKNNQKINFASKQLNNLAEIDFNQESIQQVQGQQKNYSQTCKNFNNNKDFQNRFSQNKEFQQNFQNKQEQVKFFNNNENSNMKKCSTPVNNLYKYNSYKNKENYPSQNKAVNDKQKYTFLQYQQKSQEKYRESTPQPLKQNSGVNFIKDFQNMHSFIQGTPCNNQQNNKKDTFTDLQKYVSQNQELTQMLLKGNSFKGGSNNQKISNIQDKIKSNVHQKNKEQLHKKEIQEQQHNENQNQINYNILQYQQQKQKESDKKYHLFKFSNQNSFNSDSQNEQINNNNQQMEQKIKNQLQKLQNYQVTFQSYLQQQKDEDEPNRLCKQENSQNSQNFTQFQNKLESSTNNEAQEEQDPFAQIIQNFKSINQSQGKQNNEYIIEYQNKFQIDNDIQQVNNDNTNTIKDKYQKEQNKSYLNNNSNCNEKQQQQNCHQFDQFQQQYKQKISKINQELQDMIQDLEESNYGSVSGNITLNGDFDDDLSLQTSTYNSIMVDNYSNAQNIKIFQNFSNNNYGFKQKIKKQRNESEQDPFSQFLKEQISPEEQDFLNSTIRYE
ncbi:hypothetical protein PPERSA_08002 [Pseudocohnilembus persalinus]|uniref:Uncharacterized protein n=1 Tax=Pseudocohnilembus persalinus TaxID=266149 RepID=A0A0V0R2F3_PSEPJ|nr:hypothetical protein PPERSA_08002 [Pseudocohnilembus persalinus]|eukprot:KRX08691.1 hypothetical protein PPERSA_08002 [Pseudocohnilembus persalinus]